MTTAAKPIRHRVRAIPLPLWVVFGALAGIIAGVVFGERPSILQPIGSAYAMMLQIAVYPYLLCALIFPESVDDYQDYRDYFYSRGHWFFGLLAVMFAVDVVDTAIKGSDYFHHFGPEYLIRNTSYILASLIAMKTRNRYYHGAFAVVALLYELSWIVRRYEALQF